MIPFFNLHSDEILYSGISRCIYHNKIPKSECNKIFSKKVTHPLFPCGIDSCDILKSFQLSTIVIINNYTLYPYFAALAEDHLASKIYQRMLMGHFHDKIGTILNLCPACAQIDQKTYGEAYWHRVHQIPLISHCVKHHNRLLSISAIDNFPDSGKLISCEQAIQKASLRPAFQYLNIDMQEKIAQSLTQNYAQQKIELLNQLRERGYSVKRNGFEVMRLALLHRFKLYLEEIGIEQMCVSFIINASRSNFNDYLNPFTLPAFLLVHQFIKQEC